MPNSEKTIRVAIETIEDMRFNKLVHPFFDYLKLLLSNGYELSFHRLDEKEQLTHIKDVVHLDNFKKSLSLYTP